VDSKSDPQEGKQEMFPPKYQMKKRQKHFTRKNHETTVVITSSNRHSDIHTLLYTYLPYCTITIIHRNHV
jgi:hypothetical protein